MLLATASADRTAKVWDVKTRREIARLEGHTDWVRGATFAPENAHVVTCSEDASIRIWDAKSGQQIGDPIQGHEDWVRSAAFAPEGERIISASGDGTARVWTTGGELLHILVGHDDLVGSAEFAADGVLIVTASHDGTVRSWESYPLDRLVAVAKARAPRQLRLEEREGAGLPAIG
jgi:WD40 repeat protein